MFILVPGLDHQYKIDNVNIDQYSQQKFKENKMAIKYKHQKCEGYMIKICEWGAWNGGRKPMGYGTLMYA